MMWVRLRRAVAHTIALTLAIAAITHIVVVLLLPAHADNDAWSKVVAAGTPYRFATVARPDLANDPAGAARSSAIPGIDPLFAVAVCRFDLDAAPVSVLGEGEVPFWSLAIFDQRGRNVYSLNDRTAIDRRLDLVIANPAQRARLREAPPEDLERSIMVRSDISKGFVLVRAFTPDPSWVPAVTRFLDGATCEQLEIAAAD